MKSEGLTLIKGDVVSMGRKVDTTVGEMTKMLQKDKSASMEFIERQEEEINSACHEIEEKCLDLLFQKDQMSAKEIRTLVSITIIIAKLERIADHANRVARVADWAIEEKIDIPQELVEMASVVHQMAKDNLIVFVSDATEKAKEILKRDNSVDYLHDKLSKELLADLSDQEPGNVQLKAQFLFCNRFLERMGDACVSIAKRVYFIGTGERLKAEALDISN